MSKTKKMMVGVLGAAALVSLTACAEEDAYGEPTGTDCDDWEWDSTTGSYYCDDDDSVRAGHYYYGGYYYDSKKKLKSSSTYMSSSSSGSSTYKSGIGSGTKGGFGG